MLRLEIKNTVIEIRASFFLVITFMLLICDNVIVLISLFSSLIHECGHLISMIALKENPQRLLFSASGLRIDRKCRPCLSFSGEIIIALSGVGVNLIISLCAYLIYFFSHKELFLAVCAVNLVIASFNLLPVESLDGARGLWFILCRRIPEESAQEIITDVSIVTTVLLIIFFCVTVYLRLANPSLVVVIIYLVILLINRIFQLKKSAI